MKISYKNLILASSLLIVPIKSTNTVQTVKNCVSHKTGIFEKNINPAKDFVCKPLINFQKKEAERNLNIIKMPKPTLNLDVSKTKFKGHPEFLNMFLGGVLKGKGDKFIESQEKHGINATFLIGIAHIESGNGLSDYAVNRNNIAGMRGANGYMYFNSVDECIDKMAKNLKTKYVDQGLTTIQQINKRYAENQRWAEEVVEKMNPIYQASKCKIYDFSK